MEISLGSEIRVVTLKLEEELLQKLDLYAMNSGVTRSDVIREALESYLTSATIKRRIRKTMKIITVKLEEKLLQKLDLYAINSRVTRSDIIREALKQYLSGKGGEL